MDSDFKSEEPRGRIADFQFADFELDVLLGAHLQKFFQRLEEVLKIVCEATEVIGIVYDMIRIDLVRKTFCHSRVVVILHYDLGILAPHGKDGEGT